MRISILLLFAAFAACSKPNPDACCTTQEQCDAVGLDGITGCKATGDVCNAAGACVASECATSPDCTSPDKPVCINHLCVAKCTVDDDCTGLAGTPHCGTDGVCVACVDDTQCTADAPVCDSQASACRGCVLDTECPGGVCLESQGQCAQDSDVIYVRADGSDSGTCSAAAPCQSLQYAFQKILGPRHVVHILGTTLNTGTMPISLPLSSAYIDGEDTTLQYGGGSGATFTAGAGTTEFSHVTVGRSPGQAAFSITGGTVDLYAVNLNGALAISGGTLNIVASHLNDSDILSLQCTNGGRISITSSQVHTKLSATDCAVTLRQNRFDNTAGAFTTGGNGVVIVENNVITSNDYFTDAAYVEGAAGSRVRFNSFVNISGVNMGAESLVCGMGPVDVTSNIFAWHTDNPPGNCSTRYSLFDTTAGIQPGEGNKVGDANSFFVDMAQGDFHLAPGSPAIDAAESGQDVPDDLDGAARPNGSAPDIGAYEAH